MSEVPGPDKLAKFLERNGISRPKMADAFAVSPIAVRNWLLRDALPKPEHRKAIEVWTSGEVTESDWVTDKEREALEKLAAVEPFVPPTEEPAA